MKLDDKVVLITGAAQGIGEAASLMFIREGARVAAVDLQEDKLAQLEKRSGGAIAAIPGDISDGKEIGRIFDAAVERFGGVDILINCAVVRAMGPFDKVSEETLELSLAVGVKGYFLCAQRAAREMRKRGGGIIVSMSSYYLRTPAKERSVYVTGKGAVEGMTRALAVELAEENIRVNAIAGGAVMTERRKMEAAADPAYEPHHTERVPMGRFGRVEEVMDSLLFLVTPQSSYMTGHTIVLDGGRSLV